MLLAKYIAHNILCLKQDESESAFREDAEDVM